MANKAMHGVHAIRIGIYRTFMVHGKHTRRNLVDILMPWPLKHNNGNIVYGPNLDDGFSDDETMYAGTFHLVRHGVYQFDLPKGVTARGVRKYGESGKITVVNLVPSIHVGSKGDAEIYGAGVHNPPGCRWKIEHKYKRLGG